MVDVDIRAQLNELSRLADQLSEESVGRATSRGINRALTHAKSDLKGAVQQQYKIKSSDLKAFSIFKSSYRSLTGKLGVSGKPMSLAHFNPIFYSVSSGGVQRVSVRKGRNGLEKVIKQVKRVGSGINAKGVSFEVKKGERVNLPYAFITNNDSEKVVFARGEYQGGGGSYDFIHRNKRIAKSGPDLPITKLLSTSVYGAVQNNKVSETLSIDVSDYFAKRVEHELRYEIGRI